VSADRDWPVLRVEVAYSPRAGVVERSHWELPAGSTVAEALSRSGMTGSAVEGLGLGVWGRRCEPQQMLRDGDRVELYRPLPVDPMDARRERQRVQTSGRRSGDRDKGAAGSRISGTRR